VSLSVTTDSSRGNPVCPGLIEDLLEACARQSDAEAITWPSPRWRADPVGFARDVLGVELWSKQVELLESIRDNRNTSCRSGHKCGKTTTLAVAALWFYASFPDARVLMTAVKASQVDEAMWREVRRLVRRSKAPLRSASSDEPDLRTSVFPIDGQLGERANYGLRADDGRQVWGMTARDGEGLAGISGANILILADEASGIQDRFFEVLGSSLAGSGGTARKCYISNPTRTTGEFYRSHTTNAALFTLVHISSEDTPNARGERTFKGLAGPEWIAERKAEYGEDSAQYRVRVKGDFVHDKDGKIISLDAIAQAQLAWDDAPETGDLQIGIDPAGEGEFGDETAIAVRRGAKIVTVLAWRALTEDGIVDNALGLLAEHRRRGVVGVPRISVDAEGGIGTRVFAKLKTAIEVAHFPTTEIVAVRSGKKFWGSPEFDMIRDGLWGQTRAWLKAGGALPEDVKLVQELNAPAFVEDGNKRFRATPKKDLRKALGRSTDRADAVCLAIWGFASITTTEDLAPAREPVPVNAAFVPGYAPTTFDPGAVFNPYGR
jgi:phage terminase large subunit